VLTVGIITGPVAAAEVNPIDCRPSQRAAPSLPADWRTDIPPQLKPPRSPRPWKTTCAVAGVFIALIPATNTEFQQLIVRRLE
jgi:hypothetical protein